MKQKEDHRSPPPAPAKVPATQPASDGRSEPAAKGMAHIARTWLSRDWLSGLLLVLATLIAYQPAWHAGFIWDDDVYVTQNALLTAPNGLRRIWFSLDSPSQYCPMVYTSFRLERPFWGLNPAGYHLVNILLHAANALLVWRLLRRLAVPGAWLAAALFALHPVHVESVAWITERKNVMSLLFYLLALRAWVDFVEERPKRLWLYYAQAVVYYVLALFSKTTACTLPAALGLVLWLKHKPINPSRLLEIAPFVVLGLGMGSLTMWWERYHQGTAGSVFAIGWPDRLLIASRAAWFYAGKLVWPANLIFSYPRWTIDAASPLAYVWLVAGAGLGFGIFLARKHVGRSVETAAAFYVATLSPLLGFIMLYTFRYSFVADHYQYVASIGPLALVAAGITVGLGILGKVKPLAAAAFCAPALLALGALTWRQCGMYADVETLYRVTIARNPDSVLAHGNFANTLLLEGRVDEAIGHLQKALDLQPGFGGTHNNLGKALLQKGQVEDAIAHFQKALALEPHSAPIHNNLGDALLRKGQVKEGLDHLQQALAIQPNYAGAHKNLGDALFQLGQRDEAIAHYQKALALRPGYAEGYNSLGNALFQLGNVDQAIAYFQAALEIHPGLADAHNNLANALLRKGQADEAIAQLQLALKIQPAFAEAQNNLGNALLQKGRVAEAVSHYEAAIAALPNHPYLLNNLAWVLATCPQASVRNGARAVQLAQQANQFAGGNDPPLLGTLAAAYAEAGRFEEAVATAEKARALAAAAGQTDLARKSAQVLELYRGRRPYRESTP